MSKGKGLINVADFITRDGEQEVVLHLGKYLVVPKDGRSIQIREW